MIHREKYYLKGKRKKHDDDLDISEQDVMIAAIKSEESDLPVISVINNAITDFCPFCEFGASVTHFLPRQDKKGPLVAACRCGAVQEGFFTSDFLYHYRWSRKVTGQDVEVKGKDNFIDLYRVEGYPPPDNAITLSTVVITNDRVTWLCPFCLRYGCEHNPIKQKKDQLVAHCKCYAKEEMFFPAGRTEPLYRWYRKIRGQLVDLKQKPPT
ncbi:MAG: hypothetical protein AB9903_25635 [Vulcanimicrobiota bacterium]